MKRRVIAINSGADLGRAVSELREQQGFTQTELADVAGLTKAYVSKIESGRTSSLLEHELRILRRLGARIIVEMPDEHR